MTGTGLVSIVMPTYNGAKKYIDEAIQSCLDQTYANWELIVVDDASTDNTSQKVQEYASRDKRIRLVRHPVNRKLPGALNTGIQHMCGEYFTWLSDDDLLRPNALETMIRFLVTHPNIGIVYTDYSLVDENGRHLETVTVERAQDLGPSKTTGVSHLVRREVLDKIGGYSEDLFLAEDLDFWVRAQMHFEIAPLHEDLFLYRQHGQSLTSQYRPTVYLVHAEILDRHIDQMHWLTNEQRAYAYLRLVKRAVSQRDFSHAYTYLRKAMHYDPGFIVRKGLSKYSAELSARVTHTDPAKRQRPIHSDETATPATGQRPHLVWLYTGNPAETLDAATWLETTRELRASGWRVTLIVEGEHKSKTVRGVEVIGLRRPRVYFFGQVVFHSRFLRELRPLWAETDYVLLHEMSALWLLPLYALVRPFLKKRPFWVVDTRTMSMERADTARLKDRLRWISNHLAVVIANRLSDGRLAITSGMATAVHIPPRKLWGIWPSGVNAEQFAPSAAQRVLPKPDEPVGLIYIGSLHYERNLMALCKAVDQAHALGLNIQLTLVGKGTEEDALKRFAAQTEGRIQVLPPVPHEQIPACLARAHVGVLPFPDEEKFRVSSFIKLFEYMAAGMSILATPISSITDIMPLDSYFAFWAKDASEPELLTALHSVSEAKATLGPRGAEALAAVQKWTWAATAEKLRLALESHPRNT